MSDRGTRYYFNHIHRQNKLLYSHEQNEDSTFELIDVNNSLPRNQSIVSTTKNNNVDKDEAAALADA